MGSLEVCLLYGFCLKYALLDLLQSIDNGTLQFGYLLFVLLRAICCTICQECLRFGHIFIGWGRRQTFVGFVLASFHTTLQPLLEVLHGHLHGLFCNSNFPLAFIATVIKGTRERSIWINRSYPPAIGHNCIYNIPDAPLFSTNKNHTTYQFWRSAGVVDVSQQCAIQR